MSRWKHRHLKSPLSLTVSSASGSHSGCLLHQGILLTPISSVPWQSGLPFPRYHLTLKIQCQRQRSKVSQSAQHPVDSFPYCFTSGHLIDSHPFRSVTIGPPIPEIQFDLKNSRSKVKIKGQGQRYSGQRSIQLTHFLFVSHQLDQKFLRYGKYNVPLQKTDLKFHI